MIEERCSLQCPLLTLYPSHHFPCLILYSGKFSREKGYIIKQNFCKEYFANGSLSAKFAKIFFCENFPLYGMLFVEYFGMQKCKRYRVDLKICGTILSQIEKFCNFALSEYWLYNTAYIYYSICTVHLC